MDPPAVPEAAALARTPSDKSATAVEPLGEEDLLHWPRCIDSANPNNNGADASEASRPTSPPLPPSQPAPVLLPVAPIADVGPFELTRPASSDVATPSGNAASKDEKRLRPKELTQVLRSWMERHHKPYATLEEKKFVAGALNISVAQVTNFCNNYRKRFVKVGDTLTSYRKLASNAR
ncbi:hypothetical protein T484DRAFT_1903894 [Baffinella frigidus]|nr:hypothetical protein T484DRAFT_1903894 [Cryptophyta sp. CCMP2293]